MLPERGRLIDFLMDDINPYSDAQVGAAARSSTPDAMPFCKDIVASNRVRPEPEGSAVQIAAGYSADEYIARLLAV